MSSDIQTEVCVHIVAFYTIILVLLALLFSLIQAFQRLTNARATRNLIVNLLKEQRVRALRIVGNGSTLSERNNAEKVYAALGRVQGRYQRLIPEFSLQMHDLAGYTPPMRSWSEQFAELREKFLVYKTRILRRLNIFIFRFVLRKRKKDNLRRRILEEVFDD